jgi:hypothetical protein
LGRTAAYAATVTDVGDRLLGLLVQSNREEQQRFDVYRDRLLKAAEIVPLTVGILSTASGHELNYELTPQDAIVLASVLEHLIQRPAGQSCFLNKNTKDFDDPDIVAELAKSNCKMIPRFDDGYRFLQTRA